MPVANPEIRKHYSTIGCCGIDCGLCPRFHTKGSSACPGCGDANFADKHPSCGFLTCCVAKKRKEVCSECPDFPCQRFDAEKEGYDSFVTHRKVFENLDFIRDHGIVLFIDQQKIRMEILSDLLENFDDGRSKSFFCLACALLPLHELLEAWEYVNRPRLIKTDIQEHECSQKVISAPLNDRFRSLSGAEVNTSQIGAEKSINRKCKSAKKSNINYPKEKNRLIKTTLQTIADQNRIILKLKNKNNG